MKNQKRQLGLVLSLLMVIACVKPYEPEVIKADNNFLVVDGIINCAPNDQTNITLTRTRKLNDTVTSIPERGALIIIEGESGENFSLNESAPGMYESTPLTLNAAVRYRLKINTADGSQYASEFVPVTVTPSIDSLTWKQEDNDISIYLNTHDPQNKTRYYRWEYDETWQSNAAYESFLKLVDDRVVFRDSSELTYSCFYAQPSTDILQFSTAQLSADVVKDAFLIKLSSQSPKFEQKYSINVKQFALTKDAYEYWQILKRNTQQLGSIFDAQPSQLLGNIHHTTKTDEPVIGYITAATVTEKRLFIRRFQITNPYRPATDCKVTVVPTDSAYYYLKVPFSALGYYVGNGGGAVAITTEKCVDCRFAGGSLERPTFW